MLDQLNETTRGPLSELLLNIHAAILGSDLQLIAIGRTVTCPCQLRLIS